VKIINNTIPIKPANAVLNKGAAKQGASNPNKEKLDKAK